MALSQEVTINSVSISFQTNAQGVVIEFLSGGSVQKTIGPNLSGTQTVAACADQIRIVDRFPSSSGGLDLQDVDFTTGACVSNSAPTDISLSSTSVNQSSGTNATVGNLSATDADGDSQTYTLVSGTGDGDNASFNISGSSLRADNASVLAPGNYAVRIQTNDGAGGTYAEAFVITVVDDVAPNYQSSTPSISGTTDSQTTLTVRLNEIGTAYYVVLADGAGAPSRAQVKASQDSSGSGALVSGNISISTAGQDFTGTITGLSSATAYDIYVVAEDDEGTPNLQASPTSVNVTTDVLPDSDGDLTAAGGVSEPVVLPTTADTAGESVNVFDFTLSDGGTSDGLAMAVSQVVVNVSGTTSDAERSKITWRLNGNDAINVTGTYNAGADTITFSGLSISVADGANEIYTVNAFYNDNTSVNDGNTILLSVDGDTDVTVNGSGTSMRTTAAVNNGSGSTIGVSATELVFTTQPAGSVSGSPLMTQPVVTARDAFGNVDVNFTETVTLTEASAGSLSGDVDVAAVNGAATFTNVVYTATADQQSFTLTANDQDGVGTNLATVNANSVTADVVAIKLAFSAEPSPATVGRGSATNFTTVPVVSAVDADDVVDTGYSTSIVISEVNGAGSATMTATGDSDGSANTVTLSPSSGVATFTNLQITYTPGGSGAESFNLRASSGGLTTADSTQLAVADNDGDLTAAGGVSEPVGLNAAVDTVGEATDVFDFSVSDGGNADGLPLTVSQIVVRVSGTASDAVRSQITWRLNGSDVSNVTGSFNAGTDTITFSGLNISVADGSSETYTINAYYNDNSGLTDGHTILLSVDGDTDLTVGSSGSSMGSTSAVTNGAGSTTDVAATELVFTTQPAGSVSGSALTTQPVVTARDSFGNIDVDFTETVTLTEASAGSLSGDVDVAAINGIATFTDVAYTATADQQSFTLAANDQDGVGTNLATVNANSVTADVVATKLAFSAEPSPTNVPSGSATSFTRVPAVNAVDADDIIDTGYSTDVTLSEVNGAGSVLLSGTGDTDGSGSTVSVTPSSGVATFTGLQITYTPDGAGSETFNLRASSGGLSTADSAQLTTNQVPSFNDGASTNLAVNEDDSATSINDLLAITDGDSGNTLTWTATSSPTKGSLAGLPANGTSTGGSVTPSSVTYAPTADATGADSFVIQISDGLNTASLTVNVTINPRPTVALTSTESGSTNASPFEVTATFSESVTGFGSGDVVVGNGSIGSVIGAGTTYTIAITPTTENLVTVDIPANGATDAGDAGNEAAVQFSVGYDVTNPTLSAVDLVAASDTGIDNDDVTRDTTPTVSFTADDASLEIDWDDGNGFINSGPATGNRQEVTLGTAYSTDGDKTIQVRATDDAGNSATESLTITLNTAPPSAVVDTVSLNEDTALAIDVLANDTDAAGTLNPASVFVASQPTNGSLTLTPATGKLTYVPDADFNGSDSFTYNVENLAGTLSNTATVTIAVTAVNDSPVAANDLANTAQNSAHTIDVLANDSDVDAGDAPNSSTLTLTGTPSNGLATVQAGKIVYTPGSGFSGSDSFQYRVRDNDGAYSNEATVRLNVSGANNRPTAADDSTSMDEDTPVMIDLLANDSDSDGTLDRDSVRLVGSPANGAVTLNSGSATYTPNADYSGDDSFSYVVADDAGALSAIATVSLTINPVDDAPRAEDDVARILGQVAHKVNVLGNDTDVDGALNAMTVVIVDVPAEGTTAIDPVTGAIIYTPGGGFASQDSLTYTVQDNNGNVSEKATLTLRLAGLNEAPQATNDTATLDEDQSVTVSILDNDTDVDGNIDVSTVVITTAPSHGSASVDSTGELSFQPDVNYQGSDQLQYTVADAAGAVSSPATVVFTIDPVNDAPTISGSPANEVFEGVVYSFTPNMADQEGDTLTTTATGLPAWLSLDSDSGLLEGIPQREDAGTSSSIIVTVSDGSASAQLAAYTLTVIPDLDRDGTRDSQDDDIDGDGLSNDFENQYGLDPEDAGDAAGDLDNDGLDNAGEQQAGTDPTRDDQPPVLNQPDTLVVNATGLLTAIGTPTPPQAADALDGPVDVTLVTKRARFRPGVHTLTWAAQDAAGNSATIDQRLEVNPLVSLAKNQVQVEGSTASVRFLLNGDAPNYPFTVNYGVGGTTDAGDHDLTAGSVTFTAGELETSLAVAVTDDGQPEGRETLIVRLVDDGNFGAKREHVVTVVEENIAPRLDLSVTQDGQEVRLAIRGGEPLVFNATVVDPNPADDHSFEWTFPQAAVVTGGDDPMQVLAPATLEPGVYQVKVTVSDNGSPALSSSTVLAFRIIAVAPTLSSTNDSDGDGIDDATEGLTDTDKDGQPDYLDAIPLANVLNEAAGDDNRFLVEADPGVELKLGERALANNADGALLLNEEVSADTTIPEDTVTNVGGYFDMIVREMPTAGASVNIVFPQRLQVPENPLYRKFIDGEWITFIENGRNLLASAAGEEGICPPPGSDAYEPGLTEGHWCVQLTIEDGGPNDADGSVNSVVEDPGGVGTQANYSLSSGSGGGGVMSPWWLLLGLAGAIRLRGRKALLALALLAGSASAQADSSWFSPDRFSASAQAMYVTTSQDEDEFRSDLSNGTFDPEIRNYGENRFGYSLEVGYRYWHRFSVTAGYIDFGDVDVDFNTQGNDTAALRRAIRDAYPISGDGWTLAQAYAHPVTQRLNARLELGLLRWDGEVDVGNDRLSSDIDAETDVFFGLGLNYELRDGLRTGIQVRNYNVSGQDLMTWGLRFSYNL
ncbi:tandem-95 repeat protein [Marinobacter algicola]|uniref:tandem-95 repeat protein n=1 Tax=Marinobacter algicola TaxID=236100 RepID=UPI003BA9F213